MDSTAITGTTSVLTRIERTSPFKYDQTTPISELKAPLATGRSARGARPIDVFLQEFRSLTKAKFQSHHPAPQPLYAPTTAPASADDVANEALATAKEITSATPPARAARSIITFRSVVRESAEVVSNTLGERDDSSELDEAVGKIDNGLNQLESEIANTREATTSVLAMDTQSKLNTRIRIRTQEGDIVSFSLRQLDRMKASDAAYSDGNVSASSTAVELSSSSRMRLRVEGSLNENELAAIQNVFAQAESMAQSFYGGDLAAAFNQAQGFEFDSSELARVNLRFRSRQVSNVAYIESARPTIAGPADAPQNAAQVSPEPAVASVAPQTAAPAPAVAAMPAPVATPAPPVVEPVAAATDAPAVAPLADAPSGAIIADDAIAGFFQMITNFSRNVSESFSISGNGSSFRYEYSESFKLDLLKAVFTVAAPVAAEPAAQTATQLLDAMKGLADSAKV